MTPVIPSLLKSFFVLVFVYYLFKNLKLFPKLELVFHLGIRRPRKNRSTRLMVPCLHLFLGVWMPWWNTRPRFGKSTSTVPREKYIYIYLLNRHVIVLFCFFHCRLSDWRFRNKIINTLKNQKCGSHIISTIQATDIVAMNPIQRSFVLAVIVIIPYIGLGIWLSSSLRTDSEEALLH